MAYHGKGFPIRCGIYTAIEGDGRLYVGKSKDMHRRELQHVKNGKTILSQDEVDCNSLENAETRTIRFYENQIIDGESFELSNKAKRMTRIERDWRKHY